MPGCLEAWRLEAWILEPWRLVGLLAGWLTGLDWIRFERLADGRYWWDGKVL